MNGDTDRIVLRFLAAPGEVGTSGDTVAAGRVLEWIDRAAYACAVGWSGRYCVTAYAGDINFKRAIRPGQLVEVHARLVLTGTSSMHVLVSVEVSDPRVRDFSTALHCLLVMVAVDEDGRPVAVPAWKPWSDADRTLATRVEARIEGRRVIQEAMSSADYSHEGTTPRTVLRFLAAPHDVNWGGNVHGGTVMRWMDEAAGVCAESWTGSPAVAVYAGGTQFVRPISIGALVEVDARMIHVTGRSMHLSIRVRSAPPSSPQAMHVATHSIGIYVSVSDARAQAVPALALVTPQDLQLDELAVELARLRSTMAVIPQGLTKA